MMRFFMIVTWLSLGSTTFAESLKFRLPAEPQTLDWHIATTSVETPLLMNIMEGLTETGVDLKTKPRLAQKMEVLKSGREYRFTIRPGVKWSDGVLLTAKHFVDGFERLLNPSTAAGYAYLFYVIESAQEYNAGTLKDFSKVGVSANGNQVIFKLKEPIAFFPHLLSFWAAFPVRNDLISKFGRDWLKPGNLVTVGAYVVDAIVPQTKIVLKKNPYYFAKFGNVTEVTAQIVKESSTAIRLFDSSELHVMQDFAPEDLERVKNRPEFKSYPYLKTNYLAYRVKGSALENKELRKAITQAIDRKTLMKILGGSFMQAGSFLPPGLDAHDAQLNLQYDVIAAKDSLKRSGYDTSKPLKFMVRNAERPKTIAQFIQADLKRSLGLIIQIQVYDFKVFKTMLKSENNPLFLMSWSADYPDPDTFLGLLEGGVGNNWTYYSDEKVSQWIQKARASQKPKERLDFYKKAQNKVQIEDAALLPLFYEQNDFLISKKLKNFNVNGINYFFLRDVSI